MTIKYSYEILNYRNTEDKKKWLSIYHGLKIKDIFYHPDYAHLFEIHGDGEPLLFVYYQSPADIVIYPILKRSINKLEYFSNLSDSIFDVSSPYGYGGYLRNNNLINMEIFYKCFHDYCLRSNIVSEFVRFHPIINNITYAPKSVELVKYNQTVIIELNKSENEILSDMNPTCRNKIRKAIKNNVIIKNDYDFNKLETFIHNYFETMERLGAIDYYYFDVQWFYKLIEILQNNVCLFHAWIDDKIVASSIFIEQKPYIHYFLTGATLESRKIGANNLLIYEVALWAKKRGFLFFHLGGGYHPEDTLYKFKSSFSKEKCDFYIGKKVHMQEYYDHLCKIRFEGRTVRNNVIYFPLYRIPDKYLVI